MIETPPHIILLEAIKATGEAVDFATDAGVPDVLVRHRRFRDAVESEKPCVSIEFVDDGVLDEAAIDLNAWETVRVLTITLHADADISAEVGGDDPTGSLKLSLMLAAFMAALQAEDSPMREVCDRVSQRDINPDEQSKPTTARLSLTALVLYRVRSDNPNVLLAEGVNG